MKYLKTVTLENFQSHKHSVIDFNEGLNVIVGPSDSGKSAIIRGIKWALYNEPSGDYFIREGERECSVTLEFSDNTKVKRIRSKSKNIYILIKNDGEEIKFEGFGTSVPQEIIDEIQIKKIPLDSNDSTYINLGEQLEGPFLLSEKTSTRASAIGRLIGVNIVDDALKEALRDLRNRSSKRKNLEEMIFKIEDDLKGYEYLDALSNKIDDIEHIRNLIKDKMLRLNTLRRVSQKIHEIGSELKEVKVHLDKLANIYDLESMIKDILILDKDYRYFLHKKKVFDELQIEVHKNMNLLDKVDNLDRVGDIYENIKLIEDRRAHLLQIRDTAQNNAKNLDMIVSIYNRLAKLPNVSDTVELLERDIQRLINLSGLSMKFLSNQKSIAIGIAYTEKLKSIDEGLNIYEKLEDVLKNLYILRDYHERSSKLKLELKREFNVITDAKNNIDRELDNYKSLLKKIEVCPLCFSDIDGEKIQHIMEHYK